MLRGLDSLSPFLSRIDNLILPGLPNVSLADIDPCKYTTLYSKALLIFFSTSDNTLLNRCFCIISDFNQIAPISIHATMISDTPTCHLSVPNYYMSQINYLYFTA